MYLSKLERDLYRKIDRRTLLRGAGIGAAGLAAAAIVGCGDEKGQAQPSPGYESASQSPTTWTKPNALEPYRSEFSDRVYNTLSPLGADGTLDGYKQHIADGIRWIQRMIPEEIRKPYWSHEEIETMQYNTAKAVMESGSLPKAAELLQGIQQNFGDRWYIPMSIFRNPVVFANGGNNDSDGDGITDYREIVESGTNPYNELETSPDNLSERYIVLANGTESRTESISFTTQNILFAHHLARKYGYTNGKILLFFQNHWTTNPNNVYKTNNRGPYGMWGGKDLLNDFLPVGIDFRDKEITPLSFLNSIRNLLIDNNDILTVMVSSHGSYSPQTGGLIWLRGDDFTHTFDDDIFHYDLNGIFRSMKYGKLLYLQVTSYSEGTVKNLNRTKTNNVNPISNAIGIANLSIEQGSYGSGPIFLSLYLEHFNLGRSILEAAEQIKQPNPIIPGYEVAASGLPVFIHYFDLENTGSELAWAKNFSPFIYIPISKD